VSHYNRQTLSLTPNERIIEMPTKHAQPRKLYRNNRTGIPNVYWHAATQTYCVQGLLNGKRTTIMYTKDLNEAARISKERRVTVTQPSANTIYTPLPPNDLSSGFKQTHA
jgi:hypothetical protein